MVEISLESPFFVNFVNSLGSRDACWIVGIERARRLSLTVFSAGGSSGTVWMLHRSSSLKFWFLPESLTSKLLMSIWGVRIFGLVKFDLLSKSGIFPLRHHFVPCWVYIERDAALWVNSIPLPAGGAFAYPWAANHGAFTLPAGPPHCASPGVSSCSDSMGSGDQSSEMVSPPGPSLYQRVPFLGFWALNAFVRLRLIVDDPPHFYQG